MNISNICLKSSKQIGPNQPCFFVAEIGNNHQGKMELAKEMILAAAEAGADAVKFQKRHIPSVLNRELLQKPYPGYHSFGKTYGEHREALELSKDEFSVLKSMAEDLGLVFFASAWDQVSLQEMLDLDLELLKICSADLVNLPLLRQAGESRKPIILSTGMSSMEEIAASVQELIAYHRQIVLLHCNSSYPCKEEEICLPVLKKLEKKFFLPVGYSGHEKGLGPTLGAVALGACVVERHFTLNKQLPGTDHQASLEPQELKFLIGMVRETEKALLGKEKNIFPDEEKAAQKLRKSIVTARPIKTGKHISAEDLTVKSPGTGISPMDWDQIIGRRASKNFEQDELLTWDSLQNKSDKSEPQAAQQAV